MHCNTSSPYKLAIKRLDAFMVCWRVASAFFVVVSLRFSLDIAVWYFTIDHVIGAHHVLASVQK